MAYAHSRNPLGERHDLVSHLRGVAKLAARFAAPFDTRSSRKCLARNFQNWRRYVYRQL